MHKRKAIAIASSRGLIPAQSAALAARARIRVTQAVATTTVEPDLLFQGRDAADAALRLATRYQLAWHELDAIPAHALLDRAERTDHGWAARAEALHARLVPPGLDSDRWLPSSDSSPPRNAADAAGGGGRRRRRRKISTDRKTAVRPELMRG